MPEECNKPALLCKQRDRFCYQQMASIPYLSQPLYLKHRTHRVGIWFFTILSAFQVVAKGVDLDCGSRRWCLIWSIDITFMNRSLWVKWKCPTRGQGCMLQLHIFVLCVLTTPVCTPGRYTVSTIGGSGPDKIEDIKPCSVDASSHRDGPANISRFAAPTRCVLLRKWKCING